MIKLSYRSCGARLELTDDIDRFSCLHCGSEWIVNRSGGIASLKAVEDKLEDVVTATKDIVEELKAGKSKEAIFREEQLRIEARERVERKKEEERLRQIEEREIKKQQEEADFNQRLLDEEQRKFHTTNFIGMLFLMVIIIIAIYFSFIKP